MTSSPFSAALGRVPGSIVRDLLEWAARPGVISLAGGLPAPELFDVDGIRAAGIEALADGPTAALQYGRTEGQPRLQDALARLMQARGIDCRPDDLLVTSGSQQGLDLVARALVDPGDVVVVENPTYLAALQVFALAGARLVTLPSDADGAVIEQLPAVTRGLRPKLVYLVPTFANPTGAVLSLERRRALVEWAAANEVFVLEDDPYGELRLSGEAVPPASALAAGQAGAAEWCGYTSTLSKTLAPGLRVGWLRLPAALRRGVARIKQAADLHTATFTQEVAARYLDAGRLAGHVPRIRADYRRRRDLLAGALRDTFGDALAFQPPSGGMFLWARFTDGTDTDALLAAARDLGVAFVPGSAFDTAGGSRDALRLNYTVADGDQLREAVSRLARAHETLQRDAA